MVSRAAQDAGGRLYGEFARVRWQQSVHCIARQHRIGIQGPFFRVKGTTFPKDADRCRLGVRRTSEVGEAWLGTLSRPGAWWFEAHWQKQRRAKSNDDEPQRA